MTNPNTRVILPSDPPPCGPGPYGYLVIPPGLNEESWTLESDPITEKERAEGYKCVALYARVDVAPEPGRVTAEMLEAAARAAYRANINDPSRALRAMDRARLCEEWPDEISESWTVRVRAAFEAIGLTVDG